MENIYNPTDVESKIVSRIYKEVKEMVDVKNKTYPQFNNRTLKQYIDDNEKRVNSYVESKESQGKDDWQSNVALPIIRDKMKRIIAGFSLTVPELKINARRETGEIDPASIDRADIAHKLIKSSYEETQNPVIEHFWESWLCGLHGTIVEYEGYLKTNIKQKFIKSFDLESGKVDFDERQVNVDDKCISYRVPLTELLFPTYYINDIQEMPYMSWVRYYDEDLFRYEFGKYKNATEVKKSSGIKPDVSTFFHKDDWSVEERAGKEKIEVIRYYNRVNDEYIIIANGVLLLNAPLLWSFNDKKVLPFAKTILEPFAGENFFFGKGMADILIGQYDLINTYFNTVIDKGLKSLNPPTLIGRVNQDSFDLEDEIMQDGTKFYVDDVSQVLPMPVSQISQADVTMIELLAKGIEDSTPSMPHLMQNKSATAREVVIAEEKIREMKAVYHEMLVELWRQKLQLRLANIITNYSIPRKIYKNGKVEEVNRTFIVNDTYLDKDIKERGTLAIQFRDWKNAKQKQKLEEEAAVEEEVMAMKGVKYRKIFVKSNFLSNFLYRISVIPDSLYKTSMAKMQVSIQEELMNVAQFFPKVFMANQEEYFEDLAAAYGRDPQKALDALKNIKQQAVGQEGPPQGGGVGGQTEEGSPIAGGIR